MSREFASLDPDEDFEDPDPEIRGHEITAMWFDEATSIEFVGDVGRDPLLGLEDPRCEWSAALND